MAAPAAATPAAAAMALTPDAASALYASLLSDFVSESGQVDYAAMRRDPQQRLDAYCSYLSSVDPSDLQGPAAVSFWVNVYNAFTLQLICKSPENLRSIGELHLFGSLVAGMALKRTVWHTHKITLGGGRRYTLDEIENRILRGDAVSDARIHASINCASGSCPRLARQPFTPEQASAQMDARMRDFVRTNAAVLTTAPSQKLARLNMIFSWFRGDFERELAKPETSLKRVDQHLVAAEEQAKYTDDSVASFDWRSIQPPLVQYVWLYSELAVKKRIVEAQATAPNTAWKVEFDEYDWKLNGNNK